MSFLWGTPKPGNCEPPPLMTLHSKKWPFEKISGGLKKIPSFSLGPGTWKKNFELLYRPLGTEELVLALLWASIGT